MIERFKLYLKITFLLVGVAFVAEAQAYQIVDRFQLLEDKFRTQEMLRPLEHDFIIDITALANTDVMDFVDEAGDVADFQGSDSEKLARAQQFLRQYDKTEQNLRIGVNLGIPIFSFNAFGIQFRPSIRAQGNLGFLMGIRTSSLTTAQALEYVGNDIPADIRTALQSCNFGGIGNGDDVVQHAITNCGLTAEQNTILGSFTGKYFFPNDTTVPDIYNYIKGEARVGLNVDYVYDEHFFGAFSLYGLGRADYSLRVSANTLANNSDALELPDKMNTTVNAAIDYKFGYRNGNLLGFVALEDVKLARMSDKEQEAGQLLYGEDMLIRLHGEYLYKYSLFSVKPFAGLHKRASYGLGDGYYVGADLGAHMWEDRIGLRMRGMVDSEHFTISPMMKLWLVHVEYMLKQPLASEVDGVKPSTIHSLNFRISI